MNTEERNNFNQAYWDDVKNNALSREDEVVLNQLKREARSDDPEIAAQGMRQLEDAVKQGGVYGRAAQARINGIRTLDEWAEKARIEREQEIANRSTVQTIFYAIQNRIKNPIFIKLSAYIGIPVAIYLFHITIGLTSLGWGVIYLGLGFLALTSLVLVGSSKEDRLIIGGILLMEVLGLVGVFIIGGFFIGLDYLIKTFLN